MAIQTPFQQPHTTPFTAEVNNNLRQDQAGAAAPVLLQTPTEVIVNRLLPWVGTPTDYDSSEEQKAVESAKNLVAFGQVSAFTHLLTHDESVDKVIGVGARSIARWVQDPDYPSKKLLIDYQGNVIRTYMSPPPGITPYFQDGSAPPDIVPEWDRFK
jgi:hypothetical protein